MWFFDLFKKKTAPPESKPELQVYSRADVVKDQEAQTKRMPKAAFDAMFGRDEVFYEVAELNRRATALGDEGKLNDAIECLQRVKSLREKDIRLQPTEGLRLALYLQRAGRGNDAIEEMRWLISLVPEAVSASLTHGKPSPTGDKSRFEAHYYATLFDKYRLILQREGETQEADFYRSLSAKWRSRFAALYQKQIMKNNVPVPRRPEINKYEKPRLLK